MLRFLTFKTDKEFEDSVAYVLARPEPVIIRGPRIEKTTESILAARDGTQRVLNDLLVERARIDAEIESTKIQLSAGICC